MPDLLHITHHLTAQQVADEMTRLMAYPESDAETIPDLYRLAVQNLSRKEEK